MFLLKSPACPAELRNVKSLRCPFAPVTSVLPLELLMSSDADKGCPHVVQRKTKGLFLA